ncbi:hypothetical protein PAXINDRAFT_168954 [Paxillus involutus ATCC 200175]|uniref:Uncharacterized protein n=1 Tax=Paxillus involutus ATCC 200175 TaxID=664439 RepID=A0A0C9U8Q5_PAXIN|nr:hypothetical protein PAXINDRAFT_168954 [Paxillus involutus ATCC 200175]
MEACLRASVKRWCPGYLRMSVIRSLGFSQGKVCCDRIHRAASQKLLYGMQRCQQ